MLLLGPSVAALGEVATQRDLALTFLLPFLPFWSLKDPHPTMTHLGNPTGAGLAVILTWIALAGCSQDRAIRASGAATSDPPASTTPLPAATASAETTGRATALAGWVKYVSPKCGYEVMMPAEPKDVTPTPRPGSRVSYDRFRGGSDPTVVEVICADLSGPPVDVAGTRSAVVQSSLDQGGWEKTGQRETKVGAHDATEATGIQLGRHVLIVTFFVEARAYTLIVATALEPSVLEEVKATFKLTAGQ
jgi:hypothetical protein